MSHRGMLVMLACMVATAVMLQAMFDTSDHTKSERIVRSYRGAGGHSWADRVAGDDGADPGWHARGGGEAQGQRRRVAGQKTVGAAKDRVLFVQNNRRAVPQQPRAQNRGDRGVAAESDDGGGPDPRQNTAGTRDTGGQREDRLARADDATARDARAGQDVLVFSVEDPAFQCARARVGHQHDPMAALDQRRGQGLGGVKMTAGAARGDRDGPGFRVSHSASSAMRMSRTPRSSRALGRVSDSSMPMPRPTATAEEPP